MSEPKWAVEPSFVVHLYYTSGLSLMYPSLQLKTNPKYLPFSKRIVALTPADIVWHDATCDIELIIYSCGEFSNVPLLGTHGGISYNPILVRRQFRYPMKRPSNIYLDNELYLNHEDHSNMRERFVRAWHAVCRLDMKQLGRRSDMVHESYTQWVIERAAKFGMPYRLQRLPSSTTPSSSLPMTFETKEDFHIQMTELKLKKNH